MKLTIEASLHRIGQVLSERVAPVVEDDFAAQSARLAGRLLNICANWIDDAAEIRVAENAAIRALLGEAAPIAGGQFSSRLAMAASSFDPGLKLSTLDAESHRLRTLLVALHADMHDRDDDAARGMEQRIWSLLEEIEMRRAPRE